MNWTDERVELLSKLWSEGLSASQIAAQLGGRQPQCGHRQGASAEAVGPRTLDRHAGAPEEDGAGIDRSRSRCRVPQRTQRHITTSIGATALQAQFDAEPVARHYIRPVENVVVPISRHLQLVQLTERTCKWPNGDPLSEDFNFCGNDAAETGPYCKYHARVAFQPASERRRSR